MIDPRCIGDLAVSSCTAGYGNPWPNLLTHLLHPDECQQLELATTPMHLSLVALTRSAPAPSHV